jgi:hypothetical protein
MKAGPEAPKDVGCCFTSVKIGFRGSLLGAVMQDSLLLQPLILLVVANGTAVVAKKLLAKIE